MNIETLLLIGAKYKTVLLAGGTAVAAAAADYHEKKKSGKPHSVKGALAFAALSFPFCLLSFVLTGYLLVKLGLEAELAIYIQLVVSYFFGITSPVLYQKVKPIPPAMIDKSKSIILSAMESIGRMLDSKK